MGGSGSGQVKRICKSYDLNSTRHTIKKKKKKNITQHNLSTLKNQPNMVDWIGSGLVLANSLHTPKLSLGLSLV